MHSKGGHFVLASEGRAKGVEVEPLASHRVCFVSIWSFFETLFKKRESILFFLQDVGFSVDYADENKVKMVRVKLFHFTKLALLFESSSLSPLHRPALIQSVFWSGNE